VTRRTLAPFLVAALLVVGGIAACAKDEGAATRSGCGGSASGSGAGSASSAGAASRRPLEVTVDEWSIKAPGTTKAGKVLLTVDNVGDVEHEVIVIKGVKLDDIPTKADGTIDEDELPDGAVLGEVEGVASGSTCDGGFTLEPGTYSLACNLLSDEDGKEKAHFMLGMSTQLQVT